MKTCSVIVLFAISSAAATLLALAPLIQNWEPPFPPEDTGWAANYLSPKTEYGPGHRGLDQVMGLDAVINSPVAGTVSFVGTVVDREVVSIRGFNGYLASFEPVCSNLEVGDVVKVGEEIARHCKPTDEYQYHCESCVHFSIRSRFGYLSGDYFLAALKPSVLLG
jgi:hypothetical protein